jgi:TP901 family phage tail tape measure protein
MQLESSRITGKYDSLVDNKALNSLENEISGLSSSTPNVANKMKDFSLSMKEVELNAKNSSNAIKNTKQDSISFGEDLSRSAFKFTEWYLLAGGITSVIDSIKNAVSYISQLDNSLNEIRIVTGQSQEEVQKLASSYNNLAKSMSVSTTEVTQQAVDLYRQGLDSSGVEERMQAIIKYAKISSLSLADSNKIITATMNATGESAQKVIDIFSYLGDVTASGSDEIGQAMQKVASMNDGIGVSFEKAASWIAVISSKTREGASQIGTSLKSIESRYSSIKAKGYNSEDATKINDVTKALTQAGIQATTSDGQLRNFAEVIDELGQKYSTLDKKTQNYVMTTLGGTYQMNRLRALMDGYSQSIDLYNKSLSQSGIANQKFAIWQESTAAKIDKLKASIEGMWQGVVSSNFTKGIIDGTTKLVDTFGDLKTVLSLVSTAFLLWKGTEITKFFTSFPLKIRTSVTSMQLFKDVSTAIQLQQSGQITTNEALSLSFNSLGVAAKGAGASILTAFATNPLGWIAIAITGIISVMDIMNQKAEESKQKMEELNQEIFSLKDQQKQFEDLSKEYETLSSKVSLSADEHKRLLEVQNDIAGISKNLVLGYDAEGNAILKGTDAVNAQSDAYKRMLALKLQDKDSLLEDSFNSSKKSVSNAKESMQSAGEQDLLPYDNTTSKDWDNLRRAEKLGNSYLDSISNNDYKTAQKNLTELQKLSGLMAQEAVKVQNARQQIKVALDQATQATPEFLQLPDTIQKIVLEYNNTLTKSVESGELTYKGFKQQQLDLVNILSSNDIKQAFNKYQTEQQNLLQGKSNEANVKKAKDAYINEIKQSAPNFTKLTDEISKLLVINPEVVTKNKETLDNAFPKEIKSFEDMTKEVKSVVTSVKELNDIQADLSKGNKLTADSVIDLITQYPELINYIHKTADGYTVEAQGMNIVKNALIENQITALTTGANITSAMKTELQNRLKLTAVELASIKTLDDARRAASKGLTANVQPDLAQVQQFASDMKILQSIAEINFLQEVLEDGLKTGVKTPKTKATPNRAETKEPEKLIEKDRYYQLNQELNKTEALLNKINLQEERAGRQEKIKLLDQEVKLLQRKQNNIHAIAEEERKERSELVKSLKSQGMKFSGTGDDITAANGQAILDKKLDAVNAHRNDKDRSTYNNLKSQYDDLKKSYDRFIELQITDIPKAGDQWTELATDIEKVKVDKISLSFEIFNDTLEPANRKLKELEHIYNLLVENDVAEKEKNINAQMKIKADMLNSINGKILEYQKLINSTKSTAEKEIYQKQIDTLKDQGYQLSEAITESVQKANDDKLDLYKDTIDKIKDLLKKQYDLEKDKLDESLDNYKEYINGIIKERDRLNDSEDYQDSINESNTKINDIQSEIDKRKLAASQGDLVAINEIIELQKQKAEEEKNLKDKQKDWERKQTKQNLQDNLEYYEDYTNDQKKLLDEKTSDTALQLQAEQLLAQNSITAVQDTINQLFNKTGENATKAGQLVQSELIAKLQQVMDIQKNLDSITALSSQSSSSNTSSLSYVDRVKSQMRQNSDAYGSSSSEQKKVLADKNLELGTSIGWHRDTHGVWYDQNGKLAQYATGTDDVKEISMVGEHGRELRVLNPNGKDSIIPNGLTEKLVSFANSPISFMQNLMPSIGLPQINPIASGAGSISIGDININGVTSVDRNTLPDIQRNIVREIKLQLNRGGTFKK